MQCKNLRLRAPGLGWHGGPPGTFHRQFRFLIITLSLPGFALQVRIFVLKIIFSKGSLASQNYSLGIVRMVLNAPTELKRCLYGHECTDRIQALFAWTRLHRQNSSIVCMDEKAPTEFKHCMHGRESTDRIQALFACTRKHRQNSSIVCMDEKAPTEFKRCLHVRESTDRIQALYAWTRKHRQNSSVVCMYEKAPTEFKRMSCDIKKKPVYL